MKTDFAFALIVSDLRATSQTDRQSEVGAWLTDGDLRVVRSGLEKALFDASAFSELVQFYLNTSDRGDEIDEELPVELRDRALTNGLAALDRSDIIRLATSPTWMVALRNEVIVRDEADASNASDDSVKTAFHELFPPALVHVPDLFEKFCKGARLCPGNLEKLRDDLLRHAIDSIREHAKRLWHSRCHGRLANISPDMIMNEAVIYLYAKAPPFDPTTDDFSTYFASIAARGFGWAQVAEASGRRANPDDPTRPRESRCPQIPAEVGLFVRVDPVNPDLRLDVQTVLARMELEDVEQRIVEEHYGRGTSFMELAQKLETSPAVLYAIHQSFLFRIRKALGGDEYLT